ncbi:MAG: hypothetical protein A2069_06010 [Planctomycetes bacterium GWB2_41_19]|nr:MAG: hypothetical protein A2069_06010 [Planctomycetes bacterium GWB2_41_19]
MTQDALNHLQKTHKVQSGNTAGHSKEKMSATSVLALSSSHKQSIFPLIYYLTSPPMNFPEEKTTLNLKIKYKSP